MCAEVSDNHTNGGKILMVCDYAGRCLTGYRYDVVKLTTKVDVAMGADGKDPFECTGSLELPGYPDQHQRFRTSTEPRHFQPSPAIAVRCNADMMYSETQLGSLLAAVAFAADKHRKQRRKDAEATPYINHPLALVQILWTTGGVRDVAALMTAVLHDTVEDTDTTSAELAQHFGAEVAGLVGELTDDKRLAKDERKRLQIVNAAHKSLKAKQVKLADKIHNLSCINRDEPTAWTIERKRAYADWAEQVVAGLVGVNPALDRAVSQGIAELRTRLQ